MSSETNYVKTEQHPLGSGFGAQSTADDVIAGIDLTGKLAIVTGGYSGLGLETVRSLAHAGATVIVPARRPAHAAEVLHAIDFSPGTAEVAWLDLASLDSVRAFAFDFLDTDRSIDILIDNAAIMAAPETRVGDGWEAQFATNHLGHYVLANLLWPALVRDGGARVIAVSSSGHKLSDIRWDDPQFTEGYEKWKAYGQAKTADALFAVRLDELGAPFGVRAFAVHPGGIMTPLQRHLSREEMVASGWMTEDGVVNERFKSTTQGAATAVWAATSPQLEGKGGVYCEDCDIAEFSVPDGPDARVRGVETYAVDSDSAERLWQLSARLTGVDAFSPL
ncbi:SDR family NAD(P)-dependent oxidoreductase [Glaciihabitans sp. dw_435]|uniref:SDR family NAD(P)-dependent oxidoreductase n=1 Tax=Glaciihabitans sp. dw_435 TaxID=2720081 RepID=UPI001BD55402|nr:SDR family NAD(P)-dependent oxidoreductase [Glaciihabitans sp. dw_435]